MSGSVLEGTVKLWESLGHIEEFEAHKIHCFYRRGEGENEEENSKTPLLLFLHGFPTCSYDWYKVLQLLHSEHAPYSVLAFDFLGFGLSDKPADHSYTLKEHADLALSLVQRHLLPAQKVFIIGHDMGTSVTAEILAKEIEGCLPQNVVVEGALIFNGNMVMEKASLVLGQKLLRSPLGGLFSAFNFKPIFKWQFCAAVSPTRVLDDTEIDDQWELLRYKNGHKILHKTIKYTFERVEKAERLLGAITNSKTRVHFAWGMDDPVATAALQLEAWKKLRPSAPVHKIPGLGHYPQIENPAEFLKVLKSAVENKQTNE